MNLFCADENVNLLPFDGIVNYYGCVWNAEQSRDYFDRLLNNIVWKNDETLIYGKHIVTKRKVAWYGDRNYAYTYSGTTKKALAWTSELSDLKTVVEEKTKAKFNSCLLNLYHDGNEGMAWHSDDEASLEKNAVIASVSFGAVRKFSFKHKNKTESTSIDLENGSLLAMRDVTQTYWLHSLPKSKKITKPRINLTFRSII